jgi:cytochrome c biogenesis protein CcdA
MNYLPGVFAASILLVYSLGMSMPLILLGLLEREPGHGAQG